MADTGAVSGSSATNVSAAGVNWSNPTNCFASDDARATAALTGSGGGTKTNYLSVNFSALAGLIPVGATIDGVFAEVEKSVTSTSGNPVDGSVILSKDGTTAGPVGGNISNDKASATVWSTTDTYASYGGPNDTWGFTSLTRADVIAGTFAFMISGFKTPGETSTTVRIDHVRITVYYTDAGGGDDLFSQISF